MHELTVLILLTGALIVAGGPRAGAQGQPSFAQVVALDECEPTTFNVPTGAGPDFCRKLVLGASTKLAHPFAKAEAGTPDPNWDFEPDSLTSKQGPFVSVVDQGGEPHTFTKVKQFGGGFIPALNGPGETVVPECAGGFSTVAVVRTRILRGSRDWSVEGKTPVPVLHYPWMRIEVDLQ